MKSTQQTNKQTNQPRIKMSAEIAPQSPSQSTPQHEGLSFEVRERERERDECKNECSGDDVLTPGSIDSPMSPLQYDDDGCSSVLMRSQSAADTDEVASEAPEAPEEVIEIHDVPEEVPKDASISRVQLGENPETVALLHFLAGQGLDTTKLVTEHIMKYGSRVRVAQTDEGKIVGCLIFDNETDQSSLEGMSNEEVKKSVGPFIYMQILIVAPEQAIDDDKHWKERLLKAFTECVVKNGKIAIIRAEANNEADIKLYKSSGFFTMEDMGIPSYTSVKDRMEILAFTPMGIEGTAQIFKKFYDMGARF